jgi:hypothetical protein
LCSEIKGFDYIRILGKYAEMLTKKCRILIGGKEETLEEIGLCQNPKTQ